MADRNDPLNELFEKDRDEDLTAIYVKIPSDLHARIWEIKKKTGKSLSDIVAAGLRAAVIEFEKRRKNGKKNSA